jgi:hypothetical protein
MPQFFGLGEEEDRSLWVLLTDGEQEERVLMRKDETQDSSCNAMAGGMLPRP